MLFIKVAGGIGWAARLFAEITHKKNKDKGKKEKEKWFRLSFVGVVDIHRIVQKEKNKHGGQMHIHDLRIDYIWVKVI